MPPADRQNRATGVVQVAVPVPLRRLFDYRRHGAPLPPGVRVKVPFGKRTAIGVVVGNLPAQGGRELKEIEAVLDAENLFGDEVLALLIWAANYYHHPPGEALQTALPVALRKGKSPADSRRRKFIRALVGGATGYLHRAPAQHKLYQHLSAAGWCDAADINKEFTNAAATLRRLHEKGLIEIDLREPEAATEPVTITEPTTESATEPVTPAADLQLNRRQRDAADAITDADGFASFLLHGITGSGKTEVYLQAAQTCIAGGRQALILVPEIALTPQLVTRVRAQLGDDVRVLHSALSAGERYRAWCDARSGRAAAVLGTRSAVFTPLASPGLIVVDEEHDISYKQQDGFRYHARDLAIKRAALHGVPVVLGSATPSMETRHNAVRGRHKLLELPNRTGAAMLPKINFIDLRRNRPSDGFSAPLLRAIKQRLDAGEQTIIFLNRRGFAPTAQCHHCGWQAACERCDARLTYHRAADAKRDQFRCHHCGHAAAADMQCGECGAGLFLAGAGTQRLERCLADKFPRAKIARLDRDRLKQQHQLERELAAIRAGETDIIIGTQLIAKGHDFARVTLVGVVDSDQGLYSMDFRAPEYLFQQLVQVAGRAGRDKSPGEVLIQTAHPDNRTLQFLRRHDFAKFADDCIAERRAAAYPPFAHLALWRAESTQAGSALGFLRYAAGVGRRLLSDNSVTILDAVVSPMEKLAGRYRAQLMVRSGERAKLHALLRAWLAALEADPKSRRARWSLDVDPMEMF